MIVELSWQEVVFASSIGLRRRIESMRRNYKECNGVYRKESAEQWYYNIVGACGECAVAKGLGRYWPAEINQGDAPDVSPNIQVRCLEKDYYDLIVRDKDNPEYVFVLATGEPPTFKLHGWILGSEGKLIGEKKDRGNRNSPCYWVKQEHLAAIEDLIIE